ncbi:hypothetical protein [Rhodovulum marinum]|uniref:Uncharacterized protein n=1 Tax=Rhodovulum marinum TaxID=320662 RepID=A0A4R2Q1P3_9RHOB|nr:hypothetical protein [Rhodovulum marinum]TCP40511.1 hypothetical protein EV662_107121 [Rhodovulum marinum]
MTRWRDAMTIWVAAVALPGGLWAGTAPAPRPELDLTMITLAYAVLALAAALLLLARLAEIARARGFTLPPLRLRRQDDPFARLAHEARRR